MLSKKRKEGDTLTKFTYVSLFSGIGGFEQALNKFGGKCVLASEIDKFANKAYKVLYGHETAGDITKIDAKDLPEHDLLVGGFPCQAFSVAGKRLGFEDTRGTLFFEIARIAEEKKPKALLLENVKGLVGHMSKVDFEAALEHQIEKGEIFWQRNENSLTIKSDIAKKNAESYLQEILRNDSDLLNDKSVISSKNMSGIPTEKAENYLVFGLTKRLQYLKTRISQTTKKLKDCQNVQIRQLGCKGDDLVSLLEKSYSIENSKVEGMSFLGEMVTTLSEVELLWKSTSAESYQAMKSSTTLTETNQTTELRTCISAMAEVTIIASIIKHLNLSENLLRKVSWNSIKTEENTFLIPTLDVIVAKLNDIGYTVDFEILNSKYFGVPQNRERIFIVAIREDLQAHEVWCEESTKGQTVVPKGKRRLMKYDWLKSFNFAWPAQEEVTTRLRDILEGSVDEKYYLDEEKTAKLIAQLNESAGLGKDGVNISPTIDASYAKGLGPSDVAKNRNRRPAYVEPSGGIENCDSALKQYEKFYDKNGYVPELFNPYNCAEVDEVAPTLTAQCTQINASSTVLKLESGGDPQMVGHVELNGHDAIKRVYSPHGVPPTLTTMEGGHREPKIAEPQEIANGEHISYCIDANYSKGISPSSVGKGRRTHIGEIRPVLTPEHVEKRQNGRRFKENGEEMFTLTAQDRHGIAVGNKPKYRIRKLTPLECWRLQGFPDEAHEAVKQAGVSDSQRYKQAGNAVTVNVIKAIAERMVPYITSSTEK